MKTVLPIFLILLVLIACNPSTPTTEQPKPVTYTSKEVGWTIEIPVGFKALSSSRIKANEEKGRKAIGEATGADLASQKLKHLISFQKNQFNLFNATIEPFVEEYDGEYESNNELIKKLLFETYAKQHIKIDTSSSKELINKQEFLTFNIRVYGPDKAVVLNQILYSKLINGYDFGVNINYNNEEDRRTLVDAFKNSKFEKP